MRVAVGELGPGVGDADDGSAVEHQIAEALGLDPGAVREPVQVLLAEPVVAAQRGGRHGILLSERLGARAGRQRCLDHHVVGVEDDEQEPGGGFDGVRLRDPGGARGAVGVGALTGGPHGGGGEDELPGGRSHQPVHLRAGGDAALDPARGRLVEGGVVAGERARVVEAHQGAFVEREHQRARRHHGGARLGVQVVQRRHHVVADPGGGLPRGIAEALPRLLLGGLAQQEAGEVAPGEVGAQQAEARRHQSDDAGAGRPGRHGAG